MLMISMKRTILAVLVFFFTVAAADNSRHDLAADACRQAIVDRFGTDDQSIYLGYLEFEDEAVRSMTHDRIIPMLLNSRSMDDHAAAVILSRMPKSDTPYPGTIERAQRELDLLEEPLHSDPFNINLLLLAHGQCVSETVHPVCSLPLAERIVHADPENGSSWLLLLGDRQRAGDEAGVLAAMQEVYKWPIYANSIRLAWLAMEAAERHWPQATSPQMRVLRMNVMGLWMTMAIFSYSDIFAPCDAEILLEKGRTRQQACRKLGGSMVRNSDSSIDISIGLAIESTALIALGEAENTDALAVNALARSHFEQLMRQNISDCDMADMAGVGPPAADTDYFLWGLAKFGEVEYTRRRYQRHLDRWVPETVDTIH